MAKLNSTVTTLSNLLNKHSDTIPRVAVLRAIRDNLDQNHATVLKVCHKTDWKDSKTIGNEIGMHPYNASAYLKNLMDCGLVERMAKPDQKILTFLYRRQSHE